VAALPYRIVDVFTDLPFRGNPLAVVLDAGDLADTQLAALAREFNLSETAFPVAADHSEADYRLRIFMPGKELPFAGHPSVGAAWVMATDGRVGVSPPTSTIVQSCGAGLLPLHVTIGPAGDIGPVELVGATPSVGDPLDPSATLAAIGLDAADLTAGRAFRVCSTGLPQAFLCVRDPSVAGGEAASAVFEFADPPAEQLQQGPGDS
jgi:trans-2,3-dihydro-3-hydroxyanthranilate isomerase